MESAARRSGREIGAVVVLAAAVACRARPSPPHAGAAGAADAAVAAAADASGAADATVAADTVVAHDVGVATDARVADAGRRLSDESIVAIATFHRWVAGGYVKDPDAPRIEDAMRAAYTRMRSEEDDAASPAHVDELALRGADATVIVLGPRDSRDGAAAVVFLHGWGPRWALPCWQIARAVKPLGATTACPDAGTPAAWWSPEGERVVHRTVEMLRANGRTRVVLAGLSNGAVGAAVLGGPAPRDAGGSAGAIDGLVLISGAYTHAPPPRVPTLVVHGARDAMASAADARAWARRSAASFVLVDAGHFAMLLEAETTERAVADHVARCLAP